MAFETQVAVGDTHASGEAMGGRRSNGLRALAGVALAVTIVQIVAGLNAETSWLLTVGSRWLDGALPYRDVLDTHSPMSVFLQLPDLIAARAIGSAPEPIVIAFASLISLAVIEWTMHVMTRAHAVASPARLRLAFGFALLVLPMAAFAAPETIAVAAMLPISGLMRLRAEGRPVGRAAIIVAGLGAGLAIAVEPLFLLGVLLPALIVARARRRFAELLTPDVAIAAAFFATYQIVLAVALPAYGHDMLPLIGDLYRPVREPLAVVLTAKPLPALALALFGLWLIAGPAIKEPRFAVALLAALGFALAALIEATGAARTYYPIAASLVPALLDAGVQTANDGIIGAPKSRRLVIVGGFLALAIGLLGVVMTLLPERRPLQVLAAPILSLHAHPKVIAIAGDPAIGHPLTRDIGGTWVGSVANEWMTLGALYRLGLHPTSAAERTRLEAIIMADKVRMADDIALGKPDVIIVEHDDIVYPAWFESDADLAAFLPGYSRRAVAYDRFDLWGRD